MNGIDLPRIGNISRPLAKLDKADLFRYHQADPSSDGEWALSYEIFQRASEHSLELSEVQDYYKHRYLPEWNKLADLWMKGELFRAQSYGWVSFLSAYESDIWKDTQTYFYAAGIAQLAQADYRPLWALYCFRIMPSKGSRQRFLDESGTVKLASLTKPMQLEYKKLANAYADATRGWGFGDDGGIP